MNLFRFKCESWCRSANANNESFVLSLCGCEPVLDARKTLNVLLMTEDNLIFLESQCRWQTCYILSFVRKQRLTGTDVGSLTGKVPACFKAQGHFIPELQVALINRHKEGKRIRTASYRFLCLSSSPSGYSLFISVYLSPPSLLHTHTHIKAFKSTSWHWGGLESLRQWPETYYSCCPHLNRTFHHRFMQKGTHQ